MIDQQKDFIWFPYVPTGAVTIIESNLQFGKTWVALSVAAAVSAGNPLPNAESALLPPANVVIQNKFDCAESTLRRRINKLGGDEKRIRIYQREEDPIYLTDENIEKRIARFDAQICIIDTLQAFATQSGKYRFDTPSGVRLTMEYLTDVAKRTNCAIIAINNSDVKMGNVNYADIGKICYPKFVHSILKISKNVDNIAGIDHTHSFFAESGTSLYYEISDENKGMFRWVAAPQEEIQSTDNKKVEVAASQPMKKENKTRRAEEILKQAIAGGITYAAELISLVKTAGISNSTLVRAKANLHIISTKTDDKWHWRLPAISNTETIN